MIGGAAIANFIHALPRQRLTAPRPLIDYHSALLLQPLTMGGSILGILLNRLLPDWFILVILIVVIAYSLYTTTVKFIKTWKADHGGPVMPTPSSPEPLPSPSLTQDIELEDLHHFTDQHQLEDVDLDSDNETSRTNGHYVEDGVSPKEKLAELEAYEQKIPFGKLWLCFGILLVITVHSIFLGGKGGPSVIGIRTCSAIYWVLLWLLFPLLALISWFIARRMVALYHVKRTVGFQFLNSDIEWTEKRTYVTMAVAIGAGLLSSLLGVGGGMLINPLMLELGVAPDCTAATSSLMILFTAISAIAQYGIIGRIQWDYAGLLFVFGLMGSVLGQHVLGKIVKKYKSQSYILLAMLLIIVPGGVLLVISAITSLVAGIKAGSGIGFKHLCT
jgi:uncharacterized membrane protein YfcA